MMDCGETNAVVIPINWWQRIKGAVLPPWIKRKIPDSIHRVFAMKVKYIWCYEVCNKCPYRRGE